MLKKLTSFALVAVLALSLAACTQQQPAAEPFSADLETFYEENLLVDERAEGLAMERLTDEFMDAFYPGLSEIERKQTVIYTPMISFSAYEIAMVEVSSADDVEAVKAVFQARIDSQINGGAFYPETVQAWENNAEIVVRDNYVCLFVGEGKDDMVAAFNALGQAD